MRSILIVLTVLLSGAATAVWNGFRQVDAGNLVRANDTTPLTVLTHVLRGLLAENIPLKEFRRIAAAIANAAQRSLDPDDFAHIVRYSE